MIKQFKLETIIYNDVIILNEEKVAKLGFLTI